MLSSTRDAFIMLLRRLALVARGRTRTVATATARTHRVSLAPLAAAAALLLGASQARSEEEDDELADVVNWSGTHACRALVHTPETRAEAIEIVAEHQARGEQLRPVGGALSPNGLSFCEDGGHLINLALLDKVLKIDEEKREVTVEAGCRVEQVLEALAPHGLTLENLASIAAQQVGGFVGAGAHGTGASLPPVDAHVLAMTVATPGQGVVTKRRGIDADFDAFPCSLGLLGVTLSLTLRCVPKHLLRERTQVLTRKEAIQRHAEFIQDNRHVRYMWIPFADAVVVVANNPTFDGCLGEGQGMAPSADEAHKLEPFRVLLKETSGQDGSGLGFAELRDALLALNPLNLDHVKKINQAEAEFWRRSQGTHVADSSQKLNFECGGQQWVNESCFPCGTLAEPSGADMRYMLGLLEVIEQEGIPAPSPIEQRWTSRSSSLLSPARGPEDALFSWVGVIMYLPTDEEGTRSAIATAFNAYKERCAADLWPVYGNLEHWAKVEGDGRVHQRLYTRLGPEALEAFASARRTYDPKGLLSNALLDGVLPRSGEDDAAP